VSSAETSKLTDIFEEVLPKNTRLIIIFEVGGEQASAATTPSSNDDPISIETVRIEATTSTDSGLGSSKIKASIR
jgi:hypothetical protein